MRKAFEGTGLLPDEVLWRKKEAFSDGVSSKEKSWYEIIQDRCRETISDEMLSNAKREWPHMTPETKESYYFRKVFTDNFGKHRHDILPHYWLPKWDRTGKEVDGYVDPSARTLQIYDD